MRWRLIVWLLTATSIAATFVATRAGPGITPDSTEYIAAARHLARGDGYTDFTHAALTHWPPGYSAALAIGELVGIDALWGARIVNALAFGAIVLLASVLLRRHVRSQLLSVSALVVIAWSPPLLSSASFALSETVFCAQVLGFLILLENAVRKSDRRWIWIGAAAALAGSAYLVRYAGLALVLVGFMTLLLSPPQGPRRRFVEAIGYGLAACVLPALWTVRNVGAAGSISDSGSASGDSLVELVRGLLVGSSELFLPTRIPVAVRLLALAGLVLVLMAGYLGSRRARSVVEPNAMASLLPVTVMVAVYPAFLVVSRLATGVDPPNARLLVPALVPLVVLGASGIEVLAGRVRQYQPRLVPLFAASILIYALGVVGWFWSYSVWAGRAARGYEAARWKQSQLIDQVRQRLPEHTRQVVYSNDPDAIYWVTGREPVHWLTGGVAEEQGIAPSAAEMIELLEEDSACGRDSFLAWFGRESPNITGGLETSARLDPIERVADGSLHRVHLKNDPPRRNTQSCSDDSDQTREPYR